MKICNQLRKNYVLAALTTWYKESIVLLLWIRPPKLSLTIAPSKTFWQPYITQPNAFSLKGFTTNAKSQAGWHKRQALSIRFQMFFVQRLWLGQHNLHQGRSYVQCIPWLTVHMHIKWVSNCHVQHILTMSFKLIGPLLFAKRLWHDQRAREKSEHCLNSNLRCLRFKHQC